MENNNNAKVLGGLVLLGFVVGGYFLFKKGGLDGVKKSKYASNVLQLMDQDYSYSEALKKTLSKYKKKKIKREELEQELNLYI